MSVILVTHDLGVVAGHTDEIAVMYAGTLAEKATTTELFANMKHPYTEALLRSIPRLDQPSHTRLLAIGGRPPDLITPPTGCSFAPRCPYAGDKCLTEIPELEAASADHFFACWHPVGSPRWRSKQDELVSTGVLSVTGGIA